MTPRSGRAAGRRPAPSPPRPPGCRGAARRRVAALVLALAALLGAPAPVAAQTEAEVAEGRVEDRLDRATDRRIAERLRATFGALPSLQEVEVEVRAGVVTLRGRVPDASARQIAGRLAGQVENVAAVDNALEADPRALPRLLREMEKLRTLATDLLLRLPILLVALLVFLGVAALGAALARVEGLFRRADNPFLRDLARQGVRAAFVVAGGIAALELLDATALVGAVLGAAGVFGLAVGLAFRDLVENYIASLLLSLRQPFLPNDHVRIEGHEGKVVRLTSRATVLLTFDGNHVRIPNGVVYKGILENFSRRPERRFRFEVGVGAGEDLAATLDLAERTLRGMDGVLDDPPPLALVCALGDSSVQLEIHGWVDQTRVDFGKARSEAIRRVKEAFDGAGVEMPEPTQRLRVETAERRPGPAAPAPAAPRDLAPERHLDEEIARERAVESGNLLEEKGRTE